MAGPWDAFKNVHKESHDLTDLLIKHGARPFSTYTINEARETFKGICLTAAGNVDFAGQKQEIKIPSPYSKDGIEASVYKPNKIPTKPVVCIYVHGGGHCVFFREYYESTLKLLAQEAGCIVVSFEYRLLPDQGKKSAPFDDAVVVAKYVLANKEAVGGHRDSKVGIGGDSTGGQIAISVTNDVQGFAFLALLYPHCDLTLSQPSIKEFEMCPILPNIDLQYFTNLANQEIPNQATDPRFAPLARTNLKSLPPTLIIHAELDGLKDGGLAFADKLKTEGVNVKSVMIEGVPHIFFPMCAIFKTKCAEARGHLVKFIKQFE